MFDLSMLSQYTVLWEALASRTTLWKQRKMFTWLKEHRAILQLLHISQAPSPHIQKPRVEDFSHPADSRASWGWGLLTHQSRQGSRPAGKQLYQWEWPSGDSSPPRLVRITNISTLGTQDQIGRSGNNCISDWIPVVAMQSNPTKA